MSLALITRSRIFAEHSPLVFMLLNSLKATGVGKSIEIDPLIPLQTSPPSPQQIDPPSPFQIDPLKGCNKLSCFCRQKA